MRSGRKAVLRSAAGQGALAGLVGAGAMAALAKLEQRVTGRPNSYVPARTLLTLLGQAPSDSDRPTMWNHVMHYGTGAALGALRGVWAAVGLRGPYAHAAHTVVRLSTDQTLENATGVGAPPPSWPTGELVLDVADKAVYSIVTGVLAERLIRAQLQSRRGRRSH